MSAALGLLALAVSRFGKPGGLLNALNAAGLLLLNFAVMAAGLNLLAKQAWFQAPAAALGVGLPVAALAFWKGRHGG
jgi:hypothetical protein